MVNEPEGIHNRDHHKRAAQRFKVRRPQQASHDFDTDHFVPMDARTHKNGLTFGLAVNDMHRHGHRRMIR